MKDVLEKDTRFNQNLNLGLLNSGQILLPINWATGALALDQKIDGIYP